MTPRRLDRLSSDGLAIVPPQLTDTVVSHARAGDRDAWEQLYHLFSRPLYGFLVMRLSHADDAGEALSETFLRAIEKSASFRGGPPSMRPWLFTIARNVANDRLRARKRLTPHAEIDEVIDLTVMDAEERVIDGEQQGAVLAALACLPVDDREVLWLRFGEGLSSAEVARVVGKRAGAVRMQQMRALQILSEALD